MSSPTRPVLRYHGGKWRLAPWIIQHFPPHRIYTEAYGGAGSVLLRKDRCYSECINDLDGEIVNLFRVLRDPARARELIRQVSLTPYARAEFDETWITAADPIEQARRTLFRSMAGFSSVGATGRWKTGFRGNVTRTGSTPATDWQTFPRALEQIVERLRGVVIENRPAVEVLNRYDGPETLHYVDPPYPHGTRYVRWAGEAYQHEMTDDDHRELASVLCNLEGMVVLSGYPCALYDDELYPDWKRVTREAHADGARDRTEVLWLNERAASRDTLPLFSFSEATP